MNSYGDPFGFTKQTASLLRGLGASELIPECKKRNISTDVLHELSIQELVMLGEQHISLIQAFVTYCRLRLVKERINTFVDPDKGLSTSKILPIAINATLAEIDEARKSLSELEKLILRLRVKPKRNRTRRVCIFISGIGLVTLVLFKICLT
ncbi:hypothetical protein WH47_08541 [Habropoda laboriosa]|uniref:Uncharacterized protein n=1 Tax=Habropoda laboriosa TaxID=597456 RepID=A0A0L7RH56_9HYME|nr:hypothetical protein WH47_08541 [Habropoda laboriosa]